MQLGARGQRALDFPHVNSSTLDKFFNISGKSLEEWYRLHLSDFIEWKDREHADKWLLYAYNTGEYLSIDETSLSYDELYTVVTNKAAKGKKGALVAIVKGTKAEDVIAVLLKIKERLRRKVKEVTLDMASNIELIAKRCFPKANLVTDRFHVEKLANEALQDMRIAYSLSLAGYRTGK